MKRTLTKIAFAVATAFASAASAPAFAAPEYLDFTIAEGSVPGAVTNTVTGDNLAGQYNEVFAVTGVNTFFTAAFWDAGQLFGSQGLVPVNTQLGPRTGDGLATNFYSLYGIFTASGTFSQTGPTFTFSGTSGAIDLYIDPLRNTTLSLDASTAAGCLGAAPIGVCAGNTADDYKIAFASNVLVGSGNATPGDNLANGNFEIVWRDFTLTTGTPPTDGDSYFVQPRPFHLVLDVNGQFQEFAVTGIQTTNGSANAFFTVPEPSTLALMGAMLAMAGFAGRRRKVD